MRAWGHEQNEAVLPEVRERAVRMVFEHEGEHASQWAAIASIAEKIGCSSEALRNWVRQAQRDAGRRPGLTTEERQRLRELRRGDEILSKASGLFRPGGARPPSEVMVAFIDEHPGRTPLRNFPSRRVDGTLSVTYQYSSRRIERGGWRKRRGEGCEG